MSAVKNLLELTDYLEYFSRETDKLRLEMPEELPEFYIPGWPKGFGGMEIKLGERKFMRPVVKATMPRGIMVLEKTEADVEIWIKEDGAIMVRVQKYKYKKIVIGHTIKTSETDWLLDFHSGKHWSGGNLIGISFEVRPSAIEKTACLIILGQFLEEIKQTVICRLNKELRCGQATIGEHKILVAEAQKCLAPLIPYMAADQLAKGG